MTKKETIGWDLDPEGFGGEDFPPIVSDEEKAVIDKFFRQNPELGQPRQLQQAPFLFGNGEEDTRVHNSWIQTFSGRKFNPINPHVNAIVIQDIGHSLSMQCRFSGHVKRFYSVAQHSVLVSYICDTKDAMWGLLHDASEAYLVDVPRPLKQSGKFGAYLEFEKKMQEAVCKRFNLPLEEPESVKKADKLLLATEARDLMSPLHPEWKVPEEPLPFKIDALPQQEAKNLFMKRFFELFGAPHSYQHYLDYENRS